MTVLVFPRLEPDSKSVATPTNAPLTIIYTNTTPNFIPTGLWCYSSCFNVLPLDIIDEVYFALLSLYPLYLHTLLVLQVSTDGSTRSEGAETGKIPQSLIH